MLRLVLPWLIFRRFLSFGLVEVDQIQGDLDKDLLLAHVRLDYLLDGRGCRCGRLIRRSQGSRTRGGLGSGRLGGCRIGDGRGIIRSLRIRMELTVNR